MYRFIVVCGFCLFTLGCHKSKEVPTEETKVELIMAPRSEMAILMNEMHAFNQSIRQQILEGELKTGYPSRFDQIHSAVLTDPSVRDEIFEKYSKEFIDNQKALFTSDSNDLTADYNMVINSCISCHNLKCTGPIPKIKKLLIN